MNNFSFEFTPTELSADHTVLYIANHLSPKPCPDLNIYKKHELESTFIEIMNFKMSNIIIGKVHKHPLFDLIDFKIFLEKEMAYIKIYSAKTSNIQQGFAQIGQYLVRQNKFDIAYHCIQ